MIRQGFWERKSAARRDTAIPDPQDKPIAKPDVEGGSSAPDGELTLREKSDREILAELDLPDPETLQSGDDFSAFMHRSVPAHMRRIALRRLWASNPILANLDQLVDYGEDFTDAATVVENLQTAYQVGKGMLEHVEAMARADDDTLADNDETLADNDQVPTVQETGADGETDADPEHGGDGVTESPPGSCGHAVRPTDMPGHGGARAESEVHVTHNQNAAHEIDRGQPISSDHRLGTDRGDRRFADRSVEPLRRRMRFSTAPDKA